MSDGIHFSRGEDGRRSIREAVVRGLPCLVEAKEGASGERSSATFAAVLACVSLVVSATILAIGIAWSAERVAEAVTEAAAEFVRGFGGMPGESRCG